MAKCSQCFKETGSSNALCPECIRLKNQLQGSKEIAENIFRDNQRSLQSQQSTLAAQSAQDLESARRLAEQSARQQEESNQRLLDEQRRLSNLNEERERNRIAETRQIHKESHLNTIKIKLIDCVLQTNKEGAVVLLGGTDVEGNIDFFWREILNSDLLKHAYFESFLKKHSKYFTTTKLYSGGQLITDEYNSLFKAFFEELNGDSPTRVNLWRVGNKLFNSKMFQYSEVFWNILYEISVEEAYWTKDPSVCIQMSVASHYEQNKNAQKCVSRLEDFIKTNPSTVGNTYYDKACYLCRANKIDEAKASINKHFELSETDEGVTTTVDNALRDDDLNSIRSYIMDIKKKQIERNLVLEKERLEKEEAKRKIRENSQKINERNDRIKRFKRSVDQWFFIPLRHLVEVSTVIFLIVSAANAFGAPITYTLPIALASYLIVKGKAFFGDDDVYKAQPYYYYKATIFNPIPHIVNLIQYVLTTVYMCWLRTIFTGIICLLLSAALFLGFAIYNAWTQ